MNDDSFEVGSEAESTINDMVFFFFAANGNAFTMNQTGANGTAQSNMITPAGFTDYTTPGNTTSEKQATLVLGTPTSPYLGARPTYVIALANYKDAHDPALSSLQGLSMESFYNQTFGRSLDNPADFVMTTSTYLDPNQTSQGGANSNLVFWTDISGNIKGTADEAKANPATIYIERIVAQVRVSGLQNYEVKDEDGNVVKLNLVKAVDETSGAESYEEVSLNVDLQGWRLARNAQESRLIKNLSSSWLQNAPFANWNSPAYHRSYWAQPRTGNLGGIDCGFEADHNDHYTGNYNANDASTKRYCYENTNQPSAWSDSEKSINSDRESQNTAIFVKGQVQDNSGNVIQMVKIGDKYYTLDAFKTYAARVIGNNNHNITASNIQFARYTVEAQNQNPAIGTNPVRSNTWYAYAQVGNSRYYGGDQVSNLSVWFDGMTSYYINIQHATKTDGKPLFGVIRNHIYDYTIDKVIGLGVPGADLENPDPEMESYLAAKVAVLDWRLLKRNATLEF